VSGSKGRLVYSTGPDRSGRSDACPRCAATPCRCAEVRPRPAAEHDVRVRRERAGRKGKTVTVTGPLFLPRDEAKRLLGQLKRRCGGGGALKQARSRSGEPCFELELQGDHVERVLERLGAEGYPAKRSGG
jgi:translation initiation factor 1